MNTFVLWGAHRYDVQIAGRMDRHMRDIYTWGHGAAPGPIRRAWSNRRAGW
jgi:hypothetical protein